MQLDARECLFVQEYLIDLDPRRAAIEAGYSASMAASKAYQWVSNNKVKPHVFAAVKIAMAKRAERTEITQDRVLQELAKIGFSDIRNIMQWGNTTVRTEVDSDGAPVDVPYHGIALIDSSAISDDAAAAISEISQGKEGLKIKMHDKKGALVEMGRHLGIADKVVHSGTIGTLELAKSVTPEMAERAAIEMLKESGYEFD